MKNAFDIFACSLMNGRDDPVNHYDGNTLSRFFLVNNELYYQALSKTFCLKDKLPIAEKYYGLDDPLFSKKRVKDIERLFKYNLPLTGYASPFEALTCIIFGQQVNTTLANKTRNEFTLAYGKKKDIYTLFPEPLQILNQPDKLALLPITQTKRQAILALADFFYERNSFSFFKNTLTLLSELKAMKGIGDWTLAWFRLCALRDFQSLPSSDLGVRKATSHFFSADHILSSSEVSTHLTKTFKTNTGCYLHRILLNYTQTKSNL